MKKMRIAMLVIAGLMLVASSACRSSDVMMFNALTGSSHTDESARSTCLQVAGDPGDPGGACEKMAFIVALKKAWPWFDDMQKTVAARDCLASHESQGQANPYKAENPTSTASGRYEYIDGTWRNHLNGAERYYGREITNVTHSSAADPWMQDAVAAFSTVETGLTDWRWMDCRALANKVKNKK